MRTCRGLVCCRGQGGVGNRVAGTLHACDASNRCANVRALCWVLVDPSSTLLTCSVYHIPPRRACSGGPSACSNAACAAAISSIDDKTLSLMETGFTVSPGPRRVLAVARTRSKRVYMRARSGLRQGVQEGASVALTQLPVQACGALPDNDGRRSYTAFAAAFNSQYIYARAEACGPSCGHQCSSLFASNPRLGALVSALARHIARKMTHSVNKVLLDLDIVQLSPIMRYLDSRFSVSVRVYYCSTYYKAVGVGGGCGCLFLICLIFFKDPSFFSSR
jgi:hypothetical protein